MAEFEIIKDLALKVLTGKTATKAAGCCLWDHTERLVRNVECICQLPELNNSQVQIDRFCLITAAYFSNVGWQQSCDRGTHAPKANGLSEELLEFSAQVVTETLGGSVDNEKIDKIIAIIGQSHSRFTKSVEAMILSDARNLDDMGAIGIFNEFKRCCLENKGVKETLQLWKTKIDYGYWQARLQDSFRFESVRELAEQRLKTAKLFMEQLKTENNSTDMEESFAGSALI
ncbi:hypothetical protein ACFL3G_11690 [Planctomycetota bacterium]